MTVNAGADIGEERPLSPGWAERRQRVAANIERVALELFTERGYQAVTVEDVAAAVGCSIRTVTRQFPLKEDLLLSFHRRKDKKLLEAFSALAPAPDPVSLIWSMWMSLAEKASADMGEYVSWMRVAAAVPEIMDRVNGERRRSIQAVLADIIADSLGVDGDVDTRPRVLAAALEAANSSLVSHWVERGGVDDLVELYRSAALALTGLTIVPSTLEVDW